MNLCFDTDIIIEFFRGNKKIVQKLTEYLEKNKTLFITTITLCELFRGVYLSNNPERESLKINTLLMNCQVLDLSQETCRLFGVLSASLIKEGKKINDADLLIASISIGSD